MRRTLFLLLVLSLGTAQVPHVKEKEVTLHVSVEGAPAGDLILHVGNFDAAIERYNDTGILVEFFLPWCGHSRRLRPEYRHAAARMAGKVLFARVDCSAPKGATLCSRHEVLYHPTIIFFRRGVSYEYTRRALASELTSYAKRMLADSVERVFSLVQLSSLTDKHPVIVLGFHSPDPSFGEGQLAPYFASTADNMKDQVAFASVSDPALLGEFGVSSFPKYLILRRGLGTAVYDHGAERNGGESEALSFGMWVADHGVDLVQVLTQENFHTKISGTLPGLILFTDATKVSELALLEMYEAAGALRGVVEFSQVDGRRYQNLVSRLGVKPDALPSIVLLSVAREAHYAMPTPQIIASETILEFVDDFLRGSLAPTLRSAEAPAGEEGPIHTLVAKDFNTSVGDSTMDVLVHFSSRWCGFCTVFAPVYEMLGRGTENVRSLKLYTFDLSENDAEPSLNVTAFPTVILFPAKNKTGLVFKGERSVRAMTEFLKQHVSFKFDQLADGVYVSPDRRKEVERQVQTVRAGLASSDEGGWLAAGSHQTPPGAMSE